jgi:hypothetical protein
MSFEKSKDKSDFVDKTEINSTMLCLGTRVTTWSTYIFDTRSGRLGDQKSENAVAKVVDL